jgi:integrase
MTMRIPALQHHKGTNQARVWWNGKDHYLGVYGTPEAQQRYGEFIKQIAGAVPEPEASAPPAELLPLSNGDLALAYIVHAERYYVKNGQQTAEVDCIRSALKPLVDLFAESPAKDFGPLALKAVRQRMIEDKKKCRTFINKSVGRIRRMFRWAVENEMVPATVLVALQAVAPLEAGRCDAADHRPRHAVSDSDIRAVRKNVKPLVRDLMDLALLTGARPGELCLLTGAMIDRSRDVWTATLEDHKMIHKGRQRIIAFGPKAQVILRRYLKTSQNAKLFPISRSTFGNAVKRACEVTFGMPKELRKRKLTPEERAKAKAWRRDHVFTPHWLRHNAASVVRKTDGLDAAQAFLGHSKADTTELYAHLEAEKVVKLARKRG